MMGRHTLAVLSKAARNLVAHPPTDAAGPSCASKCPISVKARLVSPRGALMFRAQILGKSPSGRAKFNRKIRYPAGVGSCPRVCPRTPVPDRQWSPVFMSLRFDYDGNGCIDLRHSVPDVLATPGPWPDLVTTSGIGVNVRKWQNIDPVDRSELLQQFRVPIVKTDNLGELRPITGLVLNYLSPDFYAAE